MQPNDPYPNQNIPPAGYGPMPQQPPYPSSQIASNMQYLDQTQAMANPSGAAAPVQQPASGNQNKLIIGLIIAAVAVVILIIAMFISTSSSTSADYSAVYEQSVTLQEQLISFTTDGSCSAFKSEVYGDKTVSDKTFSRHLDKCKEEATEMYDQIDAFGANSAIADDATMAALFAEFKEVFDTDAPGREQLDDTLNAYVVLRNFITSVKTLKIDETEMPSPTLFSEVTEVLLNSDSEQLEEAGEKLDELYSAAYTDWEKYQAAIIEYQNLSSVDPANRQNVTTTYNNTRSNYTKSYGDFNDYLQTIITDSGKLDLRFLYPGEDAEYSINGLFSEVVSALSAKI